MDQVILSTCFAQQPPGTSLSANDVFNILKERQVIPPHATYRSVNLIPTLNSMCRPPRNILRFDNSIMPPRYILNPPRPIPTFRQQRPPIRQVIQGWANQAPPELKKQMEDFLNYL